MKNLCPALAALLLLPSTPASAASDDSVAWSNVEAWRIVMETVANAPEDLMAGRKQ